MEDNKGKISNEELKDLVERIYPKPTPIKDFCYLLGGCVLISAILCWPLAACWNMGMVEVFSSLPSIHPLDMFFISCFFMFGRIPFK